MLPLAFVAVTATAAIDPAYRRQVGGSHAREEWLADDVVVPGGVPRRYSRPPRARADEAATTRLLHTDVWSDVTGAPRTEPVTDEQSRPPISPAQDQTGLRHATAHAHGLSSLDAPEHATHDEAYDATRATADHRIRLLAKRYGGRLTPEEDARLGILSARLDVMAPQVTDEDRAALADLRAEQARVMAGVDELIASLGV